MIISCVRRAAFLLAICALIAGCNPARAALTTATPDPTATSPQSTALPSPTPRPTRQATLKPLPSPSPTALPRPLVLDPGHGGIDLGACHVDANGRLVVTESEINLAIALKTRDLLEARGIPVVMTREDDTTLNEWRDDVNEDGTIDTADELQARVDLANSVDAILLLSIHQNAYELAPGIPAPDVGGSTTYYCPDRPFGEDNLRFATLVHEAVVQALTEAGYEPTDYGVRPDAELSDGNNRQHLILLGPKSDRIVRESQMVGALSESLFVSHNSEVYLLMDEDIQWALARAYLEAVARYLETRAK